MTQRCLDCASLEVLSGRGNGRCSKCCGGGKIGSIADDFAGEKPACYQCHGSGQCQTCRGTGSVLVVDKPRPRTNAELNTFDDKVAVKTVCPNCGAVDWFEWKFLGKLTDPVCKQSWYADSFMYSQRQLAASFEMTKRCVKYLTPSVSGEAAWLGKLLGGFLGIVLGLAIRLPYGLIMIPIQAVVRVLRQKATTAGHASSIDRTTKGQSA